MSTTRKGAIEQCSAQEQEKILKLENSTEFLVGISKEDKLGLCAYSIGNFDADELICEYTGELCNLDLNNTADEVLSFGKISYQNFEVGLVTDQYSNEG